MNVFLGGPVPLLLYGGANNLFVAKLALQHYHC